MTMPTQPVPIFVDVLVALSLAAGHLRELDRDTVADRCDLAGAKLQALLAEFCEEEADV
jgi:hypothetical protein